jgi:hypothetical protein
VKKLAAAAAILAVLVVLAEWPVTTLVGYNYHVTTKRWTLLEKSVAFVSREQALRRITAEVAGNGGTQEQRLLRMYDWVVTNIRPVPPGMPVVDDHVLNIFIRGYGATDQRAEALAALASYDGMPASTIALGKDPKRKVLQLTVVRVGDRVLLLDVNNHIVFRNPAGELATLNDLLANPSIIEAAGAGVIVDGVPYPEHFQRLGDASPTYVRMEKQRLLPRLKDEFVEHLQAAARRLEWRRSY